MWLSVNLGEIANNKPSPENEFFMKMNSNIGESNKTHNMKLYYIIYIIFSPYLTEKNNIGVGMNGIFILQ